MNYTVQNTNWDSNSGEEICKLIKKQPHIVLLGAGASIAVMKELGLNAPSAMKGFIQNAHLEECLQGVHLKTKSDNLEDIYHELCSDSQMATVKTCLEYGIQWYVNQFHLPEDKVSIYDKLLLSMTHQDCIYSFNWDPLLVEAKARILKQWGENNPELSIPRVHFLHGNVQVGFCEKDHVYGRLRSLCPKCLHRLTPTKLLYPDGKKIPNDAYSQSVFTLFQSDLEKSPYLTVFGYSAPEADKDYVSDILAKWQVSDEVNNLYFKHLEVIDVISEDTVKRKWSPFYKDENYISCCNSIYETYLFRHPKRMMNDWIDEQYCGNWNVEENKITQSCSWTETKNFFSQFFHSSGTNI